MLPAVGARPPAQLRPALNEVAPKPSLPVILMLAALALAIKPSAEAALKTHVHRLVKLIFIFILSDWFFCCGWR